jgi:hypothetical protein
MKLLKILILSVKSIFKLIGKLFISPCYCSSYQLPTKNSVCKYKKSGSDLKNKIKHEIDNIIKPGSIYIMNKIYFVIFKIFFFKLISF